MVYENRERMTFYVFLIMSAIWITFLLLNEVYRFVPELFGLPLTIRDWRAIPFQERLALTFSSNMLGVIIGLVAAFYAFPRLIVRMLLQANERHKNH